MALKGNLLNIKFLIIVIPIAFLVLKIFKEDVL